MDASRTTIASVLVGAFYALFTLGGHPNILTEVGVFAGSWAVFTGVTFLAITVLSKGLAAIRSRKEPA